MYYGEIELLIYLVPFVPGLYGVYRTKVWRRALFWAYCFLFPLFVIQGPPIPKGLQTSGFISAAIAGLLTLNTLIFCIKEDKALSYIELATLCLISPFIAQIWGIIPFLFDH